jgi:hypothetical protein
MNVFAYTVSGRNASSRWRVISSRSKEKGVFKVREKNPNTRIMMMIITMMVKKKIIIIIIINREGQ